MQQWRPESSAMTFDEVSMERSKSFIKALQELKSLRPQLYSAAEYCEKSYLHNEQKQMVLDNLKDYAVRTLVNAVDHLGTVAYKLTDVFEQQTQDVSSLEIKISCLNQRILTCQTYMDNEGLRQQQLLTNDPRHHKHYILPNSATQKVVQRNQLSQSQAKPRPPGTPASKTLSWHLASDTNSPTKGTPNVTTGSGDSKYPRITTEVFHLLDPEEAPSSFSLSTHIQPSSGASTLLAFGVKNPSDVSKPISTFKSFDNPHRELIRAPVRSKSVLSVFFAKSKASKPKKTHTHIGSQLK